MNQIDTLKEYKMLIDSGMPEKQAFAQVESTFRMINDKLDSLATRNELTLVRDELKAAIISLQSDMKTGIETVGTFFKKDLEACTLFLRKEIETSSLSLKKEIEVTALTLKNDMDLSIEKLTTKMERKFARIDAKFVLLSTLGSAIFFICCIPYIKSLLGH